jgi:predicted acyltransferase
MQTLEVPTARVRSIDALRGFDMFWIIGGDGLFKALAGWLQWPLLAEQMEHVDWEGFHFYDLIFPLFLFIIGVVLPFSLAKYAMPEVDRAPAYRRIVIRSLALIGLGWIVGGILQFDFQEFRWPGVLQRIGICYFVTALVVLNVKVRGQAILIVSLLLGYWALLSWIPAPGYRAGDFSMQGNLAGYIDRLFIPGQFCCHPYSNYYGDNEGLLSTISAINTTLLGVLTGQWLRSKRSPQAKMRGLRAGAIVCLALGYLWGLFFPIIKNLWTSSYVLVAGGWSLALLAVFYYLIDVRGWRSWAFFFVVIGMNSITIYVVQEFIDFAFTSKFFFGGLARLAFPAEAVILAAGILFLKWLVLRQLYERRIFLRV